jgi:ABC-2 type transport system permease protein
MRTVLSLYIASLKEFVRDRMTIFWTLAFPILFIVLFGIIFSAGSTTYSMAIVNEDTGTLGATLVQTFKDERSGSSNIFKVQTYNTENDAVNALKAGKQDIVLVVPSDLSDSAFSPTAQATVQVFYDPSKSASAQIELGLVQGAISGFAAQHLQSVPKLSAVPQSITTHNLTAIDFLIPGILAMSLMQLGLFGTAPPLVSLRQDGVLRRLGATPLPRWTLMASQVLLRLTIGLTQTAVIIGLGVAAFNMHVEGNWLALLGIVLLGALAFVGMGYLIAAFARTVEAASGITSAVNFPMMFLSGIFFPIASLVGVPVLAIIIKVLPLTYLGDALRQITVQGAPDFPLTVDIAVLAGWFIVCSLLAIRFFRWE